MPGLGGMEVLRRLRDAGNDVPVMIVTAHGTIPDAVQAMKLGAIDFLSKPLTPEELRRVVREVVERHARPEPEPEPGTSPHRQAASTVVTLGPAVDRPHGGEAGHQPPRFRRAAELLEDALDMAPDWPRPSRSWASCARAAARTMRPISLQDGPRGRPALRPGAGQPATLLRAVRPRLPQQGDQPRCSITTAHVAGRLFEREEAAGSGGRSMAGMTEKTPDLDCMLILHTILRSRRTTLALSTLALGMILFALFFGLVAACERL